MIELEQEDPIPQGDLALQITALPRETNGFGDIFGGWLVAQMDWPAPPWPAVSPAAAWPP